MRSEKRTKQSGGFSPGASSRAIFGELVADTPDGEQMRGVGRVRLNLGSQSVNGELTVCS